MVDPNGIRMRSFSADQLALATNSPAMTNFQGWIGENIVPVLPEPLVVIPPGFNRIGILSTHAEGEVSTGNENRAPIPSIEPISLL